jgi:RNA polymerase sigma-70 factor (ECF subfamily)
MPEATSTGGCLEQFRDYLLFEARKAWHPRLKSKLDPEDLVQRTLLEALAKWDQFRGTSDAELAGWLRAGLLHNLADAKIYIDRRPPEVPIHQPPEDSSSRAQAEPAADQSSPGTRAAKREQLKRLTDSLDRLPADQREAVTLHHLQGLSNAEVARHMGRSEASVAGLLRRGLKKLREQTGDQE